MYKRQAILTQFASFLRNIGAQLIEFGVMIIAFKTALKSVLANPWAAIAVGAAMVAAAAIMTALINKNAKDSVPALATRCVSETAVMTTLRHRCSHRPL